MKKVYLSFSILFLLFQNLSLANNNEVFGLCNEAITLSCGQLYQGSNRIGDNNLSYGDYHECLSYDYAQQQLRPHSGKEKVFEFNVPTQSTLTISLTGLSKDLNLFLFKSCRNVLNSSQQTLSDCIAYSDKLGSASEEIVMENAQGTYYIVVDGNNGLQNSNFTIQANCQSCVTVPDYDCDYISYDFTGTSSTIKYSFDVPYTLPLGTWRVYKNGSQVWTSSGTRNINVTFSYEGKYKVCYEYEDSHGCTQVCCIDIYAEIPIICDAIHEEYISSNNTFLLSVPGTNSSHIRKWINDDTNQNLGSTATISIPAPPTGHCTTITVYYYDTTIGAYRVCCERICNPCPATSTNDHCEYIDYDFVGSTTQMKYAFNVPYELPLGTWKIYQYGNLMWSASGTRNIQKTFSHEGKYTICYYYVDSYGCAQECCIDVYAEIPIDCDVIDVVYNHSSDTYTLSVPGVTSNHVKKWVDDTNHQNLGYGTEVTIANPLPNKCKVITVYYYDSHKGAYRICCVEVCHHCPNALDEDCNLITFDYRTSTQYGVKYAFTAHTTSHDGTWSYENVDDYNNSTVTMGEGDQLEYTFAEDGAYEICYTYPDPDSDHCMKQCCKKINIYNPNDCTAIHQTYNEYNNTFNLTLPGFSNNDVSVWFDLDMDLGNLIGGSDASITVQAPPAGDCHTISVFYKDPYTGCHQVCYTEICTPSFDCCTLDICEISWLKSITQDIAACCQDDWVNIQKGYLNSQCVYIFPPDVAGCTDALPGTGGHILDCNGNEVDHYYAGTYLHYDDLVHHVTGKTTIWSCADGDPCPPPPPPPTCCDEDQWNTWLPDRLAVLDNAYGCPFTVSCCKLGDQRIIHLQPIGHAPDALGLILDCYGNLIEVYGTLVNIAAPDLYYCESLDIASNIEIPSECVTMRETFDDYLNDWISPQKDTWSSAGNDGFVMSDDDDQVLELKASSTELGNAEMLIEQDSGYYVMSWMTKVVSDESAEDAASITLSKSAEENIFTLSFSNGVGTVNALGQTANFDYPIDEYFTISAVINLDNGQVRLSLPNNAFDLPWTDFDLNLHKLTFNSATTGAMYINDIMLRDEGCMENQATESNEAKTTVKDADQSAVQNLLQEQNELIANKATNSNGMIKSYPNPFTSSTLVVFELPEAMNATITIVDTNGVTVQKEKKFLSKGEHNFTFADSKNKLPNGMYFLQINGKDFYASHTMLLSK